MHIEVLADAEQVTRKAAAIIAEEARAAVAARGRFILADRAAAGLPGPTLAQ